MVRKTFDIKDEAVLKHLEKQVNQTQYVISLIKKDMQRGKNEVVNKEMIIAIIEEYLGNINKTNKIDTEVKNSINNVLGMLKGTK